MARVVALLLPRARYRVGRSRERGLEQMSDAAKAFWLRARRDKRVEVGGGRLSGAGEDTWRRVGREKEKERKKNSTG